MKTFEVNGNLRHIDNYDIFHSNILKVWDVFVDTFGKDVMKRYDLYLDNATEMSRHTPIIIVILKKYLIIKLGIEDFSRKEQIVYQFSHELCHYVFFSLKGIEETKEDINEENICSAMSLILINILYPESKDKWLNYVNNLENEKYNKGGEIAISCNWDIEKLKEKIYEYVERIYL